MAKINDLSEKLNPTFFMPYLTDKPNKLLKGGRSGTKSSAISQMLVEKKMQDPKSNVICFRQKENSLRMSIYNQIIWALGDAGVLDKFQLRNKPMTILHKEWNTGFYFMGMDDPQKVKGLIIETGHASDLWFEEADSLRGREEIDTVVDTLLRVDITDNDVKTWINNSELNVWVSYNPPRNPYHWINEWVKTLEGDPDWLVHHSTYLDDLRGYNSESIIRKIKRYKENDPDYYRWMYLGEVIGLGTNIYNIDLIKMVKEVPDNDPIVEVIYSADTGHQTSATSVGQYGISSKGNLYRLGGYYYDPIGKVRKKAPSELSKEVHEYIKSQPYLGYELYIDSAEGAFRNQYYLDHVERWKPVAKKKKFEMIDYTHDLIAQGRFFVVDNDENKIFIEQAKQYAWDEKTMRSENPQPIKENDHTVDEFQYIVISKARRLKLRR